MKSNKDVPIVLLHGWGVTGEKYHEVALGLEQKGYTVYAPDLPGFGNNPLPKDALDFDDYLNFVYTYIKSFHVPKVMLIGHSFGGRIAIRFTTQHPELVEKLILTGASGILHPLSLKKRAAAIVAKVVRSIPGSSRLRSNSNPLRFLLYRLAGGMDYYKAGELRKTFINVHQVSIVDDLPKVTVPTLLIWGAEDRMTSLTDGQYMQQHIPGATLEIVEDASHKLPYEDPRQFVEIVEKFL